MNNRCRVQPQDPAYRLLEVYRRTVSSEPRYKRLIRVESEEDEPRPFGERLGDLCPFVLFYKLLDQQGGLFWAKRWTDRPSDFVRLSLALDDFLNSLKRSDVCVSVDHHDVYGQVFPFNQALFHSRRVVHYWDRRRHFSPAQCLEIEAFAGTMVRHPVLPVSALSKLTDFQIVGTPKGLVYLDFEPAGDLARSSERRDSSQSALLLAHAARREADALRT